MRWTERQRAMLREMGIRLWLPEDAGDADHDPASGSAVAAREPALHAAAAVANAPVRAPREASRDPAAREAAAREPATPEPATPEPAPRESAPREPAPRESAPRDPPLREPTRRDAGAAATPPARAAAGDAAREPMREPVRIPGLAPADWLVVAEPLDAADPQQQQLLENMLRAIGVGLVAPTREKRAVFLALDAAALAAAVAGSGALGKALDAVAPRCALALGRTAAAALLGDGAPLGALRGRVHAHAGVPVVVTFPLAFLLRHPAEKAKAWADLCLAVRALASPAS